MSFLGIQPVVCNNTLSDIPGTYVSELGMHPIYSLIFTYASLVALVTLILFCEACHFIATRMPRSCVANHRLNTAIIMSIFPVFIITCLPSLLVPEAAAFCLALADLYYSFTMFKFIVLQIDYYGGHRKMMVKLTTQHVTFRVNVPVLCCFFCFKPVRLTRKSFLWLKIGVLQIAILKPLMTFTQAIMAFARLGGLLESLFIVELVTIVTTLVAVTSLNMMTGNSANEELREKYYLDAKAGIMTVALILISLQKSIIGIGVLFRPLGCLVPLPTHLVGNQWQCLILLVESTLMMIPVLRYYRTADGNVVGVPQPYDHEEQEPTTGMGKLRHWIRRHTLT